MLCYVTFSDHLKDNTLCLRLSVYFQTKTETFLLFVVYTSTQSAFAGYYTATPYINFLHAYLLTYLLGSHT